MATFAPWRENSNVPCFMMRGVVQRWTVHLDPWHEATTYMQCQRTRVAYPVQWPTFFDGCSDLCNLWWLARAPSRDFQEPSVREARINLTWRWITKHNQVDGCPLCGPGSSRMPLTPSLCWCHQSYQTKSETFDNFDFVEHWWSVPMLRFTGASKMMFAYMVALFPKCKTPQGVPWPFWASTIEGNSCSSLLFSSVKLNTPHMREMEGEYCPKHNIYFQNTNTTPAVSCFFFSHIEENYSYIVVLLLASAL